MPHRLEYLIDRLFTSEENRALARAWPATSMRRARRASAATPSEGRGGVSGGRGTSPRAPSGRRPWVSGGRGVGFRLALRQASARLPVGILDAGLEHPWGYVGIAP